MSKRFQQILFCCSIFIYLFYSISAYFTHTLDPFFVHATIGQDFFQIPNGAYAFLHGGSLTGSLPKGVAPYINCCGVNHNVYHPLFTLLVGIPLQLFPPWTALTVWAIAHIIVMGILVFFLWKEFRQHRYIYLGLSLLLLNSYNYYEIWLTQYHFLFTFFTVLFLYESTQHGDTKKAGIWFFLSLLVKPIGLLWVIPLLLYKRFQTVLLGFGLFAFLTFSFTLFPFGRYYLDNFFSVTKATIPTHNIYTITHLMPEIPLQSIKLVAIVVALSLIVLQMIKKPNFFTIVSLWIGYALIFYSLVYHYHYTILGGIICLGILLDVFSLKKFVALPIIFLTLPAPTVLFSFAGQMRFLYKTDGAILWLYAIFWLVCLLMWLILSQNHKITPKPKR